MRTLRRCFSPVTASMFVGGLIFIPTDAALKLDIDVPDEAILLERLFENLETVKQLRLIIIDACRRNPFDLARSDPGERTPVDVSVSNKTLLTLAAKPGTVCDDSSRPNSIYTRA